jgi:hypothetical protein
MHLVAGLIRLLLANISAGIYSMVRIDMVGRAAIRLSCDAFLAGAGIDEAAVQVIRNMGSNGTRLLQAESSSNNATRKMVAGLILKMLGPPSNAQNQPDARPESRQI